VANRLKQMVGGGPNQSTLDRLESCINENSLSQIMNECLNAKAKNVQNREILQMEKDFHQNREQDRHLIKTEVVTDFQNQIQAYSDQNVQLEELKVQLEA
jgi:hypothetical protein